MSELDDFLKEVEELAANPPAEDESASELVLQAAASDADATHLPANAVKVEDDDYGLIPAEASSGGAVLSGQEANDTHAGRAKAAFAPRQAMKPKQVVAVAAKSAVVSPAYAASSSSTGASASALPSAWPAASTGSAAPAVRQPSAAAAAPEPQAASSYSSAGASSSAAAGAGASFTAPHAGEKRKYVRMSAGETWHDPSLAEWPDNDFRLFCGDLGHDVTDEMLAAPFRKFKSFVKAKMIVDRLKPGKTKGYGFVSFLDPYDGLQAMKEVHGQYIGLRPVRIRRSTWQDRNPDVYKDKAKEAAKRAALGLS